MLSPGWLLTTPALSNTRCVCLPVSPSVSHPLQLNSQLTKCTPQPRTCHSTPQITEVLAQQHAELTNLHEQYENKDTEGHLRLGK